MALEKDGSTEIVIHVNKLKEGWDVTNLYTIVPVCTENLIRVDDVMESPKLAE